MARAYATTRMPRHQARAIQMPVLTGCCASRWRIVLTMDVTGWLSAKARTGPGMVRVGTNAELMNGRKMIGEEKAPALGGDVEAIDGGRPRVGPEQRGQDFHDRGLTCAVGAEQGEDAAPRHVEGPSAQHPQLLVRLLKTVHADRLDVLCCHRDTLSFPPSSAAARSMALVSCSRSRLIHSPSG